MNKFNIKIYNTINYYLCANLRLNTIAKSTYNRDIYISRFILTHRYGFRLFKYTSQCTKKIS